MTAEEFFDFDAYSDGHLTALEILPSGVRLYCRNCTAQWRDCECSAPPPKEGNPQ